jgi:multiple sugar transport system substrate-binding protein
MSVRLFAFGLPAALVAAAVAASASASVHTDGVAHTVVSKTTITFWDAYSPPTETGAFDRVIRRFETLHKNVAVKPVHFSYNDLQQKLLTATAGGSLPDALRSDIIWVPQYAKLGVYAPLDKVLPGFKAIKKTVYPGPLATNFWHGHYYGLPLDTNTRVQLYNRSALEHAGLSSPPKTFAQVRAMAPKLKAKGIYMFADGGTGGWNVLPWIWSAGGSLTNKTYTKATGYLNSRKSISGIQLLVDLYKEGALPNLILGASGALQTSDGVPQGKYATILDGPWMFPIWAGSYPEFTPGEARVPAGAGGSVSVVGGEDIAMIKSTRHAAATKAFIRFMLSPWAQLQMAKAGQMPVVKSVGAQLTKIHPYYRTFVKQLATARPRTPSPNWAKIDQVLSTQVADAISGKETTRQALTAAAHQIDGLLK